MLNEFYDYIAGNIVGFFQNKSEALRPGERYCLKLDTVDMVSGVDEALRSLTKKNNIQGYYSYGNVYSTFTIKLSNNQEVVVASKINGMTDDFFTTLRNAELTSKKFPILMITHSTIDSIASGTGDLAANGMPFHAYSIIQQIKHDIGTTQLSVADKTLLLMELERKQQDRYSDKSSLFEYAELLTVLGRGMVKEEDYPSFALLPDPDGAHIVDEKKIRNRLNENYRFFKQIDNVVKHGNIVEDLEKEFDKSFIDHLQNCKKTNTPWYENYTYHMVKSSQDKLKKKLDNPLSITDMDIYVYSGSRLEYSFQADKLFFIRDDGETSAKRRRKNILIYNPDKKERVAISVNTNKSIRQPWIEATGCSALSVAREVTISIKTNGCIFSRVIISDPDNNIKYLFKICVVDVWPEYLEAIQTSYLISAPKNLKKANIQALNIDDKLVVNPGKDFFSSEHAEEDGVYDCNYNQTLILTIDEDSINPDTGILNCVLKCGPVSIPIQIQDEKVKPTEITGIAAFKRKHHYKKSLEYRDGKIIAGTTGYYARSPFKDNLALEALFVEKGWQAVCETVDGPEEWPLSLPDSIRTAYLAFINVLRENRTLPSLAYYNGEILQRALEYVDATEEVLFSISAGEILDPSINNTLLLGCSIQNFNERIIKMSPLHPLNVLYQIRLLSESEVGEVREKLVEKLSALYLIPFIKDEKKNLYHAIEQKHSPEWRFYAPISNKRFQGARNYVQKLVCDKIIQYKEHFKFLFDDIGNRILHINLVNMGDCKEVFQGLIRFYHQSLGEEIDTSDMLSFVVNIYSEQGAYNAFSLLSDQQLLRESIKEQYSNEDVSELVLAMTDNVRCFFRNPKELNYQYAHLTFYEMGTSEEASESRMNSITTGVSIGGIVSGLPSVLNAEWYKTGFGMKYTDENRLTRMAAYYNAMYRVAFSGSSFEPKTGIFTEIEQGLEGQLGKIYSASNWVVFIDPKVDLSFFNKDNNHDSNLMIIHYSDQYTSASGYDDITVTQKSEQYNEIIYEQLLKKGVTADPENIHDIINFFNAINGSWLLRLITAKKMSGAADSYFSREKMSILSAIKVCMAYYSHPNIVWIPISLEEMLRVSGGAGLSQKDGLLSAKSLGFEQRATSDDILLVGIEGPEDDIKIYLHPVEVKIGLNPSGVITKANLQLQNTYTGLRKALWPIEGRNSLECKLSRNFFIQLLLVCCEKLKMYNVYPDEKWDDVLDLYRENLLNEKYEISDKIDRFIGKGTIVSFGTDVLNKGGSLKNDVCILEFPEKMGSSYMVLTPKEIEKEIESDASLLPIRLKMQYFPESRNNAGDEKENIVISEDVCLQVTEDILVDADELQEVTVHEDVVEDSLDVNDEEESDIGMKILFGTDVVTGNEVFWEPNDTDRVFHTNTGIIGTMGTGKTQFTKSLVTQIYKEQIKNVGEKPIGILIFDYKGDYNESKEDFIRATKAKVFKPYNLPFNPLALTKSKVFKPLLPVHTANAFKDTLSKVYGLGPKQQNTLFQCIVDAYETSGILRGDPATWNNVPPTFNSVYELYNSNDEIKKSDSLAAAMEKLYNFQVFEADPEKTVSLFDLLEGVVVIDLSGYDSDIQSLIVAITLDLFYAQMQAAGSSELDGRLRQITKLILVDEADNFMSENFPALKKILKEGREFGVGTILSTQFLKHFGNGEDDYSKYILTWVVHNVADLKTSDVEFVFKTETKSADTQTLYHDIKSLKKHHSIVKVGNNKPEYIIDKAFWQLYDEMS